ncbi:MAG: cytochrome b N-terminal domain-containing protein [Chloroflexi bacterium]|nr:cytochrome b N-terminal domain-containing protein [Chloroflexota bacterium]
MKDAVAKDAVAKGATAKDPVAKDATAKDATAKDSVGERVKRLLSWWDDRIAFSKTIVPILEHRVPPNLNWWYVLGSATLVAFMVQVVTGVALAFTYVPSPNSAYASLEFITNGAMLGNIVRGMHYFGSSAMVVLITVHMAHVFLTGSYKFPREVNWLSGVVLFVLTLGMAFSGQLLRWNQDAYWALVVGAEQAARVPFIGDWFARVMIAGHTVGGATLTRFYATHVFLFPALMFGLIGLHLFLVIYQGISEPPKPGEQVDPTTYRRRYHEMLDKVGVPFWPDAAWKDVVFAVGVGVVVLILSIAIGPPVLGPEADPTNLQADPRPDWYFLWYFALLALLPDTLENWFMVGFPLLIGIGLVITPFLAPGGDRAPSRRPWAIAIVGFSFVAVATLTRLGDIAPWSPVFAKVSVPASQTQGLSGPAAQGAQLFAEKDCIACHTIAGVGGQRGPNLTDIGARLSKNELTWRILNGGHNMPAYGRTITPDQLSALVAFLSQQRSGPAERTANAGTEVTTEALGASSP